jgi:hypothetical protein
LKGSYKLIEDACRGIRPERTPIFDLLRNTAVIEYYGGHALDGVDDWQTVWCAAGNALDGTRSMGVPQVEGTTWTDEIGNTRVAQRWTTWTQTHALNTVDEWAAWIKGHTERLLALPFPTAEEQARYAGEQAALNSRINGTVCIHCTLSTTVNSALFGHCGLEIFSYLWADHRELTLRWLRALEHSDRVAIERTAHLEQSPLAMIYSDMAYKGRLMLGRHTLKQMGFWDNVADLCARCHARGMTVIFHSDGNIMELVDDLVAAGIDGINPLEKAAGMDVYELRRRHPQLIMVGGLDVTHLFPFGTPDEVRAETRRMIDELGSEGRLLIGSSTEVGDDVPIENYLAFHDEVMRG